MRQGLRFNGVFTARCYKKPRNAWEWLKWNLGFRELKWIETTRNLVVNQGLNHALDVIFHGTTQVNPWYVLLFESNTTILATHTYAAPGFTECTAYDEAARPAYVEAAASAQQTTNSANRAVFTINATKTIYGAALVSLSTKGDTAGGGVLWCAAQFTNSKNVEDNDIIEVTYTLTGSDDGI